MVIEIKADKSNRVAAWKRETQVEAYHAKADFFFLVVRTRYQPVEKWEAHMPLRVPGAQGWRSTFEWPDIRSSMYDQSLEDYEWIRMDLRLAVEIMTELGYSPSRPSSPTTE